MFMSMGVMAMSGSDPLVKLRSAAYFDLQHQSALLNLKLHVGKAVIAQRLAESDDACHTDPDALCRIFSAT